MINKVKSHIYGYFKSDFARNAAKLFTSTAFSQMVLIATTPILYRLYGKEDFGAVALYVSLSTVLSSFCSLQYTQAILLEQEDEDAFQILYLTKFINLFIAIIILFVAIFERKHIAFYFNSPTLVTWLILLPVSVFFLGHNEVLRTWANRKKQYKIMAWNTIITCVVISCVSIAVGLSYKGSLGLFMGVLFSQVISSLFLEYTLRQDPDFGLYGVDVSKIKKLAGAYIGLPKYILPAVMINQINSHLPLFMLSALSGSVAVGIYSLSLRVLGMPSQLLSNSIAEVFKQRATEDSAKSGNFRSIFVKTFKILLGLSIVPFMGVILFAPDLFAIIFGDRWREAGVYSQAMAIMFLFRLTISPLTYAYYIKGKQREDLYLHVALLTGTVLTLYFGLIITGSVIIALLMYSVSYSLLYTVYLIRSYKLSAS